MMRINSILKFVVWGFCTFAISSFMAVAAEQKPFHDEAQLVISLAGKEIGQEKFSIQASGDSIRSSSSLSFRDPANSKQLIKLETELVMNSLFVPVKYQLRTEVNGQKGIVRGSFEDKQATFEYAVAGVPPRQSGLLVGEQYSILDTNVFHHFAFIARLFDFQSKVSVQPMEVVIPQELRNGLLQVRDAGLDSVSIRGKKRNLHHLKADSGSAQIDLWVDDQHILYRIALPLKHIEVTRN